MSKPHMARIALVNLTDKPLSAMQVTHVFGDEPPELLAWTAAIEPGANKRSETKNVTYGTGFGNMTSHDWWLASWQTSDGGQCYLHSTAPSFFNLVGNYFIMQGAGALDAANDTSDVIVSSDEAKGISKMSASLAKLLFGGIARKVDKSLLKQHILKDEDAYDPSNPDAIGLVITVSPNGKVTFTSPSGKSEAEYTTMAVPPNLPAQ